VAAQIAEFVVEIVAGVISQWIIEARRQSKNKLINKEENNVQLFNQNKEGPQSQRENSGLCVVNT
jgi:hypothetical protein